MTRRIAVPADLQPWIEAAVVVRTDAALARSCFPALAGSQLVLRLSGEVHAGDGTPLPTAALLGASLEPTAYRHLGAVHAVGLVLWPHAAPALFRAEGCELAHRRLAISDLLGAAGVDLQDAVAGPGDDDGRMARLFAWVRARVHTPQARRELDRRLRMARAVTVGPRSADVELGWSRRHLQRRFTQDFGLAPKPFHTLQRLKAALHDGVNGRLDGAELALAHGYYDQSHLARDLRRLAGEPLTQLRGPVLLGRPEHWALRLGTSAPR